MGSRCAHRCNFFKSIEGAQRTRSVQGTIKILMETDLSLYLTPFLANIGQGAQPIIEGAQPNMGGGVSGSPEEI